MTKITAVKGFNKDLTCRGFQFTEGATYEQDTPAVLCRSGFHAVIAPLDVFNYYPPAESVYHTVELEDLATGKESDSKVAARKITIGATLGVPGLVHVEWVLSNAKEADKKHSTGDRSAASSTGYQSAALSNGSYGTARTSHKKDNRPESVAIATGYKGSAAGALGDSLVIAERDDMNRIITVKSVRVDGKKVLPDVFYTVRDSKVVAA